MFIQIANNETTASGTVLTRLMLLALIPANVMSAFTKLQSRQGYFDLAFATVVLNNVLSMWTLLTALFVPVR